MFPFEEGFFRQRGVNAYYIGHPLARVIGRGSAGRISSASIAFLGIVH
ncbi:MAG: hypothetical protein QM757_15670 [Paludibaculum sp.]